MSLVLDLIREILREILVWFCFGFKHVFLEYFIIRNMGDRNIDMI